MAKRILIVDDEPDICEILRFNLEMDDYEAFTAESADEAQQIVDCSMLRKEPINLILRNIFSNTLAYATNATFFRVEATPMDNILIFRFIDNGVGVPSEQLPHIFERFYRIDKGRSRRLGGTGLGLAIVKNIAIRYGGSATAFPTPKGGLTIEVQLAQK